MMNMRNMIAAALVVAVCGYAHAQTATFTDVVVKDNLSVSNDASFRAGVTVAGSLVVTNDIEAYGTISGEDITVNDALTVLGYSSLYNPLTMENGADIYGDSAIFTNTLRVDGLSEFYNTARFYSGAHVYPDAIMSVDGILSATGTNLFASWDRLQLAFTYETLPVYLSNVVALATQGVTAVSLGAITNETDTLATVLARGNDAGSRSVSNLVDISGSGRIAFGENMTLGNISANAYGAQQSGSKLSGSIMTIGNYGYGAEQRGSVGPTASMRMGENCGASSQYGYLTTGGDMEIGSQGLTAVQRGSVGASRMYADGAAAQQYGYLFNASATNLGRGALQIFDLTTQHALTTAGGAASILLGAGTSSNKNAIVACTAAGGEVSHGDGSITAGGGFYGNGAVLTGDITARDSSGGDTDIAITSPNGAQMLTLSGSDSGPFIYMGTSGDADAYAKFGAYDNVINFQANGRGLNFRSDTITSIISANHTNGNVGIGTNAPTERLHVVGNITATGSITAGGGFYGPSATLTATLTASNIIQTAGGWDDLLFPVSSIYVGPGFVDIEYLPQSNSINFKATCNTNFTFDNVWLVSQLSHSTKTNSAFIHPHVHFVQNSATQTNMFFLRYKRYKIGEQIPATWTDLPMTNNIFAYSTGTIHQIADGASLPGPFGISENFDFKIWSRGGSAVQLKFFDIHFQRDSLGSDSEYQKTF
jgi:hypothetical protein